MNQQSGIHQTAIRLNHLTKTFGDVVAVDDLSLEVRRGEVFGFLGPNGAGKTTTINMICDLLKPDSGEVLFCHDTTGSATRRPRVGLCPQENIFWPKLTCMEQLVFLSKIYDMKLAEARQRACRLMDQMGLTDKKNKRASTLSGGLKRRLNICMALVHDPDVVVFDEPEAGLDPQSRVMVREFIREIAHDKTIILTTHNMDEAERVADRVAIIDHGKLLTLDSPENLKKSVGEGDTLEIQFGETDSGKLEKTMDDIRKMADSVQLSGSLLIIRSRDIIERLADITLMLKNAGIPAVEVRLRENSLEDVFICLTGRKLRE